MSEHPKQLLLVGAGAIGQLIAHQWQCAKLPIVTLPRSPSPHADFFDYHFRDYQSARTELCRIPIINDSDFSSIQAVFIAVKAYDLESVFRRLDTLGVPHDRPIICAHNGLVDLTTSRPCYTWITTHGVTRSNRVTEHKGLGSDWIDARIQHHQQLTEQLHTAFPKLHFDADIKARQWQKFCLNCVINPLTAVNQCLNGELLKEQYHEQRRMLVSELVSLSQALGYRLNTADLLVLVEQVCEATAENQSSMLSDIKANRKTEIKALTGYALKKAAELGVNLPTHAALYHQFNQLYLR
ncbi:MAG TPA: hypothetical protein DCR58_00215 [Idiomarina baltica]|uniref:2-dehydropantoate 2-reductase n=1 Tax=Idiomarina baltica TaxID=190892 RepID=A0A348WKX2_9GAMM|nr:hypothetical protein [Idiomarina baltica]|tara:strand:- start:56 stop:946 length:891 start_codon:yes stop_codon:yes gene_type:complete